MINVKPMDQMIPNTNNNTSQQQPTFVSTTTRLNTTTSNGGPGENNNNTTTTMESRKARPQEKVNCPICNSTNTKFCYYNNYSLTQPRYFCKGCRRYWTQGGILRNVPVGGSSHYKKTSHSTRKTLLKDSTALWRTMYLPRNLFSDTLNSVFLCAILMYYFNSVY